MLQLAERPDALSFVVLVVAEEEGFVEEVVELLALETMVVVLAGVDVVDEAILLVVLAGLSLVEDEEGEVDEEVEVALAI